MADQTDNQGLSRRAFLKAAALVAACWPALLSRPSLATERAKIAPARLPEPSGALPLSGLVGERLTFNISFWLFSQAGSAVMSLKPMSGHPGIYEATLCGQTSGAIGFFTRHRLDTYRSAMQYDGRRFRPLEFEEEVIIGGEVKKRRTTVFNYASGVIERRSALKGGGQEKYELPMRPGVVYDDYLSGIYNLRSGAYGAMREGRVYILNVPHKKGGTIRIELASREGNLKQLERERDKEAKAFFSHVVLDKDNLITGSGRLQGWFSSQGVPVGGIVEDVVFLGDVRGTLISRETGHV
jgi:hypothetical protein